MEERNRLKPPEDVIARLKRLIKKMEGHFENLKKNSGITHAQFRVICPILKDGKGYSIQELSEIVGVDKGFVSRTVTNLEKKGITKRDKETGSKERNYKIIITEEARRMFKEIAEPHRKEMETWLGSISKKEIINFIETLYKLTEN